jgi:hypothetical protein
MNNVSNVIHFPFGHQGQISSLGHLSMRKKRTAVRTLQIASGLPFLESLFGHQVAKIKMPALSCNISSNIAVHF